MLPSAQMGESSTAKHPANASAMLSTPADHQQYQYRLTCTSTRLCWCSNFKHISTANTPQKQQYCFFIYECVYRTRKRLSYALPHPPARQTKTAARNECIGQRDRKEQRWKKNNYLASLVVRSPPLWASGLVVYRGARSQNTASYFYNDMFTRAHNMAIPTHGSHDGSACSGPTLTTLPNRTVFQPLQLLSWNIHRRIDVDVKGLVRPQHDTASGR